MLIFKYTRCSNALYLTENLIILMYEANMNRRVMEFIIYYLIRQYFDLNFITKIFNIEKKTIVVACI